MQFIIPPDVDYGLLGIGAALQGRMAAQREREQRKAAEGESGGGLAGAGIGALIGALIATSFTGGASLLGVLGAGAAGGAAPAGTIAALAGSSALSSATSAAAGAALSGAATGATLGGILGSAIKPGSGTKGERTAQQAELLSEGLGAVSGIVEKRGMERRADEALVDMIQGGTRSIESLSGADFRALRKATGMTPSQVARFSRAMQPKQTPAEIARDKAVFAATGQLGGIAAIDAYAAQNNMDRQTAFNVLEQQNFDEKALQLARNEFTKRVGESINPDEFYQTLEDLRLQGIDITESEYLYHLEKKAAQDEFIQHNLNQGKWFGRQPQEKATYDSLIKARKNLEAQPYSSALKDRELAEIEERLKPLTEGWHDGGLQVNQETMKASGNYWIEDDGSQTILTGTDRSNLKLTNTPTSETRAREAQHTADIAAQKNADDIKAEDRRNVRAYKLELFKAEVKAITSGEGSMQEKIEALKILRRSVEGVDVAVVEALERSVAAGAMAEEDVLTLRAEYKRLLSIDKEDRTDEENRRGAILTTLFGG